MSDICQALHQLVHLKIVYRFPFDANLLPKNGIYFLFEQGEEAHGTKRIVRVGTHTGINQLTSRLEQHFLKENKDRSIFRKNIGRALLNRDHDPFVEQWELDLTTAEAKKKYVDLIDFVKQKEIEKLVSEYIQKNLSFVVFQVDEKEKRLIWESKLISTISLCEECKPSANWLGHHSPMAKIRQSGMWNVNELYKTPLSENDLLRLFN